MTGALAGSVDVTTWTLWLAAVLSALGLGRLLTTEEPIARLVALNVTGAGTLLVLVGLSTRTGPPDAVPQALALTGIVITVAVTGVALVLAVRSGGTSDEPGAGDEAADTDTATDASAPDADETPTADSDTSGGDDAR